jgi:predicted PurR-regulated permease PerM
MPEPPPPSPTAALVPLGLRRATAYTWRLLLLIGAALLVLYVLSRLRAVVLPVIAALLLAALVDPVARRLRATPLPNWVAALTVLLGLVLVFAAVGLLIVPEVIGQIREVNINLTQALQRIERFVIRWFPVSEAQFEQGLRDAFATVRSSVAGILTQLVGVAGLAAQVVIGAIVTLFLLFFFVKDGPRFYHWLRAVAPEGAQRHVEELLPQIWETLRAYLVGVVIVGFVDAVLIGLALVIVGVPLVLPLAVLTFFGAFFPLVGAVVAGTVATLVALVTGGIGDALLIAGAALLVQQAEGNLLQPVIMGRQVELHPAVTLLSVTAGGALAGIVGAFLAVPVAAVTRRTMRYSSPRLAAAGDAVPEERKRARWRRRGATAGPDESPG